MFYPTDTNAHGMAHDPFKAIVAPRPIGWIGTKGRDGSFNLSPYSFFNIVADRPKLVMFASSGRKHSLKNAEETGVFTASLASRHIVDKVNASSRGGIRGQRVRTRRSHFRHGQARRGALCRRAHAVLECRTTEVIQPRGIDGEKADTFMVFGQVVGIHISETIIRDGRIDMALSRPIGRMGYLDYADGGTDVFQLVRPST